MGRLSGELGNLAHLDVGLDARGKRSLCFAWLMMMNSGRDLFGS